MITRNRPSHILVRSANWVGDAIMTTPTLRALRKGFPEARITLLAKPWVIPVFANSPHVDAVMTYPAQGVQKDPRGMWRLVRRIRAQRFDCALLLQNAFEAALLAWLASIPRRAGYTTDARALLLTDRLWSWRRLKKGHLIDYYLGLLRGFGLEPDGRRLELFLTAQERQKARAFLFDSGLSERSAWIGLNPGAAHGTAKRWPLERYAELGRRLMARYSARLLVFGSPQEADLGAWLAERLGPDCLNLAGRTSLRQALALIGCCRLFITNDSGLMHAAAALEVPQVAVIGPTDPVATGPVNAASRIVQSPSACNKAPCLLAHCPIDHRCMATISVERVWDAASELLASGDWT